TSDNDLSYLDNVKIVRAGANNAPLAADDCSTLNEDTPLTAAAPTVLTNDRDPDGDALTASLAGDPAHGTVMLASSGPFTYAPAAPGNASAVAGASRSAPPVVGPAHGSQTPQRDGSFVYRPDPNSNGADRFTYQANDRNADGNVATVSITVNPVNDPPVAADD